MAAFWKFFVNDINILQTRLKLPNHFQHIGVMRGYGGATPMTQPRTSWSFSSSNASKAAS